MNSTAFVLVLALLLATSLCLEADPSPISNVTVMGTVFCDACANNVFSEHSYFLAGVRVRVQCMLRVTNSTSREEMSITVDRTTDKFGVYKLDIPPVEGFECREGVVMDSCCRASLLGSPSSLCDVPGLNSSTGHVAVRGGEGKRCLYNLNALNYRPSKKDANLCGTGSGHYLPASVNSSLFLWPPSPPSGFPWPSPMPYPFPPLPFQTPPPPSLPWPFPPLFPTPRTPTFPLPFPPAPNRPPSLPPIPPIFPSPTPTSPFPFRFPPFPPFTPMPPLFMPPSLPPPGSFPFPFPPFPPTTTTSGAPSSSSP
ncbi:unnamed protein product [Musa acuminata subsp. malaccensis]|uniref:(wild Malaysian banana) hypothetical protein n=1 Tax=Musa acuminata subsp. malaccensis TaxID=214687 RepID=A0A804KEN4_MUSAM|nr:PREDICTED: leucine-rich repeat extensin-like protein 3 [Musa acuminata subsp. malaccensis]CAG1833868.1 unnamed protein product [Musa acuminata subsp. malaccensis]